jgi:multidrug transporter EmrE-like cation transporter
MTRYIPLILAVVTTNAISQLLLKHGMNKTGHFDFDAGGIMQTIPKVLLNPYIILGGLTLVFSMGLHLLALSRVDISFAYPFLSVSYVIVLIAGYLLFGESINAYRIAGVGLICIGTVFVAQS